MTSDGISYTGIGKENVDNRLDIEGQIEDMIRPR